MLQTEEMVSSAAEDAAAHIFLEAVQVWADCHRNGRTDASLQTGNLRGLWRTAAELIITVTADQAIRSQNALSEMSALVDANVQSANQVASSAEELTALGEQMLGNSEETAYQADLACTTSDQVSKYVNIAAAGAEGMGISIRATARSAADAAKVARDAVTAVETANQNVAKLGDSSREIGKVIKVITSIAQQTNLLALNATIEAARAGSAGRGFAVVATEVKELARATAGASEQISLTIETIQHDVKTAIEAIKDITLVIGNINQISIKIASAAEEQTITTSEIERNVMEAAKGSKEVTENITAVVAAARFTNATASETLRATKTLTDMAGRLKRRT